MGGEDGTVEERLPTPSASSYLLANTRLPQKMLRLAKGTGVSCISRAWIWGLSAPSPVNQGSDNVWLLRRFADSAE
jgi:hypothetical protein